MQESGVVTSSKILLWCVSPHTTKEVGYYIRQMDDSQERLNHLTPVISDHHHPGTGVAAQEEDEQVSSCHETHKGRMTIERDQVLLDPLANSPLKIWEVQSGRHWKDHLYRE